MEGDASAAESRAANKQADRQASSWTPGQECHANGSMISAASNVHHSVYQPFSAFSCPSPAPHPRPFRRSTLPQRTGFARNLPLHRLRPRVSRESASRSPLARLPWRRRLCRRRSLNACRRSLSLSLCLCLCVRERTWCGTTRRAQEASIRPSFLCPPSCNGRCD